jgi:16S rRNA (guanine527-N7)-methyltransferase
MDKFDTYTKLLLEYNKVHRLSGAKDTGEVDANIEDSLYPMQFLDTQKIKTAVDIGTGAGFPGMILAMAYPDIHFTLVEPLMKRTAFLHLVKSKLGLDNVTIKSDRIENITPFEADLITSRAVAKTGFLIDLAKGFIGEKTTLLFYKGEGVHEEIDTSYQSEIINRGKRNYLFIKGTK